eukprot:CAMPEP_0185581048 /NCGR_PEP_ID=MMETSP0434-20130131/18069_1 /TAXON_ID=626734 ORGANISM="Favella taraikaensis, Strain Fe Narragansett Bay" /NCGR_SAMPLE_ID=MMETSP0434 /ASSEMBLY_ACC=CAM_ASM_000379 /LENGTH=81 /DNA_ID=CAMNT_0028199487 /DNA_START=230 /DNA_END=475 /DNA_ORIENTATION=+
MNADLNSQAELMALTKIAVAMSQGNLPLQSITRIHEVSESSVRDLIAELDPAYHEPLQKQISLASRGDREMRHLPLPAQDR